MHWYRWEESDLILELKLQPGASRSEFVGLHGNHLKLRIHAPAVDGKANSSLIAFLAEAFDTSKQQVRIERGELSRIKSLRICAPQTLPTALLQLGLSRE
jgi:uncharacterized protein (TIGR00251 family)